MSKRVSVRYLGGSHYTAMKNIPAGTEFKAVESLDHNGKFQGVYIRGSSLTKACNGAHKFSCKQYLFIIDHPVINNQMEIIK